MLTPYMTLKETAKYLKLSEITIYRMIQRGDIPAIKLGRSWRVHRNTLEEFLHRLAYPISSEPSDVSRDMIDILEHEIDRLVPSNESLPMRKSS